MGGSSKKTTVGYKYFLGMHMVLCHGPVDSIKTIYVDEEEAWSGLKPSSEISSTISISKEDLFGGESSEGGISGYVNVEYGSLSQSANDYLQGQLGSNIPAYRGVVSAILRQVYLGMNPYLKQWWFKLQRIHTRQDGIEQWYDEKSEIGAKAETSVYNEVLTNFKGLSWVSPCTYSYNETSCTCVNIHTSSNTMSGNPNTLYYVTFRLRGVVELNTYYNGESLSEHVVKNADSWSNDLQNVYKLEVSNPSSVYYLNNGTPEQTQTVVDTHFTIAIYGGATITLIADARDGWQVKNTGATVADDDSEHPIVVDQAYDGQFMQIDTENVTTSNCPDMNPAHIIYECLTDSTWGMGYPETDIDDDAFKYAADLLYSEGFGISILWNSQTSLEDFIKEMLRHIDATLYVDRKSGKFVLKLIRGDYDEEDLISLNESNVDYLGNFSKTAFSDLVNSVTVNYYDAVNDSEGSVTVKDSALIQILAGEINTSVEYQGITSANLAIKLGYRDLKSLSFPRISCNVYTNRVAKNLNVGDCFKLSWSEYEISNVVMRVTGISYGDGKSNRILISCTQDVFGIPSIDYIKPPSIAWEPIDTNPVAVSNRLVIESPYLELIQRESQTNVDSSLAVNPEIGYVLVSAIRPTSGSLRSEMYIDYGYGYSSNGNVDFCPSSMLNQDIDFTDTTFDITNVEDIEDIEIGSLFQIDDEIFSVESISTSSITAKRGVLDTLPAEHTSGSHLFFWDNYGTLCETEFVTNDTVNVKLLTSTNSGQLSLDVAPVDSVTLQGRAARPYPPGNVKLNGEYFPDTVYDSITVTFAHRNRIQQTTYPPIGWFDGTVTNESGVTYSIEYYQPLDTLINSETEVTTESFASFIFPNEGESRIKIKSKRGDLESLNYVEHIFNFVSLDIIRITEDGSFRTLENNDYRTMEI